MEELSENHPLLKLEAEDFFEVPLAYFIFFKVAQDVGLFTP